MSLGLDPKTTRVVIGPSLQNMDEDDARVLEHDGLQPERHHPSRHRRCGSGLQTFREGQAPVGLPRQLPDMPGGDRLPVAGDRAIRMAAARSVWRRNGPALAGDRPRGNAVDRDPAYDARDTRWKDVLPSHDEGGRIVVVHS